jgi:hypothetical protein
MTRQSRKPQATTESIRDPEGGRGPSEQSDRAQDDTQDRVRTDDALSAARLAGLDARVVVRPTIVLGPAGPSGFKLDGSTLRGALAPDATGPTAQPHVDPEAFGLVTLPPSLVDDLVTGPLPEPDEPQATNYLGDDCQTVRLTPEAAAQLALRPTAWDGALSQAETIARAAPVSEDAVTWALGSVDEAMQRPLPPPPSAAASAPAGAQPPRQLGRTWRSPTFPTDAQPQPRSSSTPLWAWLLAAIAVFTVLVAYLLTSRLMSREPSPRLEPFSQELPKAVSAQHGPSSAAISSNAPPVR